MAALVASYGSGSRMSASARGPRRWRAGLQAGDTGDEQHPPPLADSLDLGASPTTPDGALSRWSTLGLPGPYRIPEPHACSPQGDVGACRRPQVADSDAPLNGREGRPCPRKQCPDHSLPREQQGVRGTEPVQGPAGCQGRGRRGAHGRWPGSPRRRLLAGRGHRCRRRWAGGLADRDPGRSRGWAAPVEHRDARRRGDIAEKDATFAVRFALAAVEEAEYAVLYATLARMGADSLAAKSG